MPVVLLSYSQNVFVYGVRSWVEHTPCLQEQVPEYLKQINLFINHNLYYLLGISWIIFLGPWILLVPLRLLQAVIHTFFIIMGSIWCGMVGIGTSKNDEARGYRELGIGSVNEPLPLSSVISLVHQVGAKYNAVTAGNGGMAFIRLLTGIGAFYLTLTISQPLL